jgi:RHS repeat-associated protein
MRQGPRGRGVLTSFRLWAPLTGHIALVTLLQGTFCASGWPEVLDLERRLTESFPPVPAKTLSAWESQAGGDRGEMPAGEDPAGLGSEPERLKVLHQRAGPAKRGTAPPAASPSKAPRVLAAATAEPGLAAFQAVSSTPQDPKVFARPPPVQIPPPPTLPVLPQAESAAPSTAPETLAAAAPPGEVSLAPGWNLISLPVEPASIDPAAVLLPIAGRFDLVHAYDACATADPWRTYDPAATSGNTLTALDHRIGFWIRATAAATLPVSGTTPAETAIQLCPGWNLIGYPLTQPRSVPNALHSIAGKYLRVYGYEPNDSADPWEVFDVATPDWANDLQTMLPGRGYWVFATEATTLTLANTGPPPDVAIASPGPGTFVTAPTAVVGTVESDLLDHWTLAWRRIGETGFTPFATGNAPVDNAALATFDPSLLINGLYEIELTATDFEGRSTAVTTNVIVEGRLKVGNFTVSFTDLEVPVAGIPIQVIRTYDSRDRGNGDFGAGWTLSLTHARLQESDPPGDGWQGQRAGGTFANYCIAPLRPKTVTITLPDDTVYRFRPTVTPACQLFAPPAAVTLGYAPLPGTTATLTPVDQSGQTLVIGAFPGRVQLLDEDFTELADPNRYKLTLRDGRELVIDQSGGLASIKDLNGNQLTFSRTGIGHSSGKTVTFERDTQGRITKVIDPAGQAIEYGYNAAGDLIAVSDRMRQVSRFGYDNSHYLLTIEDPRGIQPLRNEYDDSGRLVRHIDAFGKTIEFTHDLDAHREVVTNRLGHSHVLDYDARGNVVRETDPLGKVTTRVFDTNDLLLSQTDPLGNTTTYKYNANQNLTEITDPLGHRTSYTHDAQGHVLTTTDARGKVTTNVYDMAGNLLTTTDPLGSSTVYTYDGRGRQLTQTDSEGAVTEYGYDNSGNVIREVDALGTITTSTYDANGSRLTRTTQRTTPRGVESLVWLYEYDGQGRLKKTTEPDSTSAQSVYDPLGNLVRSIDKLSHSTIYKFDDMGRLTETNYPDGTKESSTYDTEGRRLTSRDRGGRTTTYAYDAAGLLTTTTFPDNAVVTNAYDDAGKLASTTDARGNTTTYTYDAVGRRTKVRDALGHETVFTYDENGDQVTAIDARGGTTTYEYDNASQLVRVLFMDRTSTQTGYDRMGRRVSETDQAGAVIRFGYDKIGRLSTVTDALQHVTRYTYDEQGNRVAQTDANGHITRFEYDALGRITRRVLPDGAAEQLGYDAAGNLTTERDFAGRTISFSYDLVNRLTQKTYPDGTSVGFTYNATGRRASTVDARGTTSYTYDERDRIVEMVYPDGRKLAYAWDANGNRTELTAHVAGQVLTTRFTYDALNRLDTVTDPRGGVYDHAYDANGNRTSVTYPNRVQTSYNYDTLNRLTELRTWTSTGAVMQSYAYTLGPAGDRTKIEEHDGTVRSYLYDAVYRLSGETLTRGGAAVYTKVFGYDPVGNRLQQEQTDPIGTVTTINYSYDERDRLLIKGSQAWTWDTNGNLTAKVAEGDYEWDYDGRLQHVTLSDGTVAIHAYDADGVLVRTETRKADGTTMATDYLVDTSEPLSQVVAETTSEAAPALLAYYIRDNHLLAVMRLRLGGEWTSRFYYADGLGTIRALADESGAATDLYGFTAFGELLNHEGQDPNAFLFTGEQLDSNTGFYYNRARWMDPGVGRFVSRDQFEVRADRPLTLHRYTYAEASPVDKVDPSGRMSEAETLVAGKISLMQATIALLAAVSIVCVATLALSVTGLKVQPCGIDREEPDTSIIFYRGTGLYDATDIMENGLVDIQRIIFWQDRYNAPRPGFFITSQYWNANYWADLSYAEGQGGGPAILQMIVPKRRFQRFTLRHGIAIEAPMPTPPLPGMTETLIPFHAMPEFSSFTSFSLAPVKK